ncbi:MAG: TIGR04141 family sporadically distributed protein [Candidatus Acidiferrales bacterium]
MADDKLPLTIFLIKSDRVDSLERELGTAADGIFELAAPHEGRVFSFPPHNGEPSWAIALKSALENPNRFSAFGQSPSAVMLVMHDSRMFALSFGHAAARLQPEWLERDFDRRVALNSVQPNKLVEIHLEQVFAKWHVARERAPRATSVDEFGVEFDRDLVARVEGFPKEKYKVLGGMVRGGTNLRVKVPFSDLSAVLEKSSSLYASKHYQNTWPEIDKINPIQDDELIGKLELQLDKEMTDAGAMKRMVMLAPLHRQEEDLSADSYVFGRFTKNSPRAPYLMYSSWLGHLEKKGQGASVAKAKKNTIHILGAEKNSLSSCSVFDCLGYELAWNKRQYILSSGVWYEVDSDFISDVDNLLKKKLASPKGTLPTWDGQCDEAEYNLQCARAAGFLSFDSKNILYGGSQSKFEFCDILHLQNKTLYFAKIPNKSSGVSHLVEQVRRTVELTFGDDSSFREAVQESMKKHHNGADTTWLDNRPKNSEWNLCMVLLGKSALQLPFFARCSIRRLFLDMRKRGFEVSLAAV